MELYDSSILKAVEFIEKRINEELTLAELAREASFSKFHFTRIFKAITKEPVNEYIRKRRMTLAAKDLIETSIPIIQIALTYGYTSQEAFSRAFKTFIDMTPQSYRKKGVHYHNLYKEALSETLLQIKKQPVRQGATIIEKPSFFIGGMATNGDLDNHIISKLWNQFYEELKKQSINPETARCYGYESLDGNNTPYYLAAIEVDRLENLPDGWSKVHIPAQKYAVFTLDNVIENIAFAIEEIYKNQLRALNVKPVMNYHFEFYDEEFTAHDSRFTLQIFVPIE
ncbi:MAG TPA: helix-turn-helix domain-containing protein [Pseudoneobacillus sp.]|nr:helix-turn-helix domain-containing protein [Pseudoneobacillus sp.]